MPLAPASPAATRPALAWADALLAASAAVTLAAAPARSQGGDEENRRGPRDNLGQRLGRQVNVSVDASAASITYDGFAGSGVASVTPTLRVESARTVLLARSSFSRFESGNRAVQTSVAGSIVSPAVFHVRGELYGGASVARFARTLAATSVFGAGRLHAAAPSGGGWAGLGLGLVSQGNLLPSDAGQLDFGAWAREGPLTYTAVVQPTRVGALRYLDATAAARWQGARGEMTLTSGFRARAPERLPGVRAWAEGWLTLWVGQRVALVGGAGLFPFEPLQGLPGGRYVSAAVRLATRRPAVDDPTLRAELMLPYEVRRLRAARAELFVVQENPDGSRTLLLQVPRAQSVEVMGDFTDWTPVELVPLDRRAGSGAAAARRRAGRGDAANDVWAVALVLAPGVHRVNVRVDGGPWRPPPGLSVVRDEFGGEVGLLVVQ
jgi:hypothetical protein